MTKTRTYTCEECGGTFEDASEPEESKAEYQATFPGQPLEDAAVVCDDCYEKLMARARKEGLLE